MQGLQGPVTMEASKEKQKREAEERGRAHEEAHIRRMNEQLRENQDRTTELKLEKRLLERRIVTLETKIEALEEDHENLRR